MVVMMTAVMAVMEMAAIEQSRTQQAAEGANTIFSEVDSVGNASG